jgi:hypothetical protein
MSHPLTAAAPHEPGRLMEIHRPDVYTTVVA